MSAFDLETIFADQVRLALTEVIDRLVEEVSRSIRTLEIRPDIRVTVPPIAIPGAPNVTVGSPDVEVTVDLAALQATLSNIETLLFRLIEDTNRPVRREVTERDADGRIKAIEDRKN